MKQVGGWACFIVSISLYVAFLSMLMVNFVMHFYYGLFVLHVIMFC